MSRKKPKPPPVERADFAGSTVVLFDGICGMCNATVQFLLKRDRRGALGYASLQSDVAREVLARHGRDASDLDTVYVVTGFDTEAEQVFARSSAVLRMVAALGGVYRAITVLRVVPTFVRDFFYDRVASNRYRMFGKREACMVPSPEHRARFLAV
jgi:predicted DCC family thiol-disulfide oxidoreductase YuxK